MASTEYRHGIYMSEVPTNLLAMVRTGGGITVAIGTAPVHLASNPAIPNAPIICRTYNEAVSQLGYSTDTKTYTLCEVVDVMMGLYQVAPIVFINVLDPAKHASDVKKLENQTVANSKTATLEVAGIIPSSITVKDKDGHATDFDLTLNDSAITITFKTLAANAKYSVEYKEIDASKVTATDITAALALIDEIYPRYGYTIGQIIAPGWSDKEGVGLAMAAKARLINGHFSAHAFVDINAVNANAALSTKSSSGFASPYLTACYPHVTYGGKIHCLSTHLAGLLMLLASEDGDVPFRSPSNQTVYIDGMCNADGTSNYYGLDTANALNGAGIMTVTNFDGWKAWGNRTSCYPGNSDPKDSWLNVRRMFDYVKRTLTLSFWSKIDMPITPASVNSAVNSANIWLSSLVNQGALLGGRVVFSEDDNSNQQLMDGILTFHCWITPPSPAEVINFTMEYDPEYQSTVFSEG